MKRLKLAVLSEPFGLLAVSFSRKSGSVRPVALKVLWIVGRLIVKPRLG
jgi:hypothetical protein